VKTPESDRSAGVQGAETARLEDDLARVKEQEAVLVLQRFDEAAAFDIGAALRARALSRKAGIVIEIRLWDRPLFYAALEGSTASTGEWARRKLNVVRMFHKSSYRVALEQKREDRTFPVGYGLSSADFVLAGGAFPLRVAGVGVIGAIAVSGLSQREDHEYAFVAMCEHLEQDPKRLALDLD